MKILSSISSYLPVIVLLVLGACSVAVHRPVTANRINEDARVAADSLVCTFDSTGRLVMLVDLTLPEESVRQEQRLVSQLGCFAGMENIRVSFLRSGGVLTPPEQLTDSLLEHGFVAEPAGYRHLLAAIYDAFRKTGPQADTCAEAGAGTLVIELPQPEIIIRESMIRDTVVVTVNEAASPFELHAAGTGSEDRNTWTVFYTGLVLGLLLILECYLVFQFLVPYFRDRRLCKRGIPHYYNGGNLFDPRNAPACWKWILAILLAAVLAWTAYYLVQLLHLLD